MYSSPVSIIKLFVGIVIAFASCNDSGRSKIQAMNKQEDTSHSCMALPSRFGTDSPSNNRNFNGDSSTKEIW